jgi:hypothetical protein
MTSIFSGAGVESTLPGANFRRTILVVWATRMVEPPESSSRSLGDSVNISEFVMTGAGNVVMPTVTPAGLKTTLFAMKLLEEELELLEDELELELELLEDELDLELELLEDELELELELLEDELDLLELLELGFTQKGLPAGVMGDCVAVQLNGAIRPTRLTGHACPAVQSRQVLC